MTPAQCIETAICNLQAILTYTQELHTQNVEHLFDAAYDNLERAKDLMSAIKLPE